MPNLQLAKNLYMLRKSHMLTQDYVSVYLNISRQAYSNYETSKRTPDLDTLIVLAQLYRVSLDKLVNDNIGQEICEIQGPYHPGLSISTGDTIYLAPSEVDLVMNYRSLSAENRMILEGFCNAQDKEK